MVGPTKASVFEFKLPDIGEGVTEGEIVALHVQANEHVREDQPMLEVMTDKATVTINVPVTGTVTDVRAKVGEKVKVGSVLITIRREGADAMPASPPAAEKQTTASAVGDLRETLPGASLIAATLTHSPNGSAKTSIASIPSAGDDFYQAKPLATPALRKLARDMGLDLRHVRGSGSEGRITKEDLLSKSSKGSKVASRKVESKRSLAPGTRQPFIGLRRKIAERMQQAKQTAAHVTFVEEFAADQLVVLRDQMRQSAEARGIKLNFLPFIIKATVLALKKFPSLNSHLDTESSEWVFEKRYDIGIATATEQGLLVPVLRNADQRTLLDIAIEIERLAQGARDGTLDVQELGGSTFTVTSLGAQGGLFATPVLNMPEVGILGVHRLREKPVVRNGQIVVGQTMTLSLSFDHRLIDGHVGAAFTYEIIGYLEDPSRLMLEMI